MVVYAELEVPSNATRIGRAFGTFPDVRVELDRIVPTVHAVVPFMWVNGADPNEVMQAVRREGAVQHITRLGTEEGEWSLYRVVWNRRITDFIVEISDANIALLSGEGTADSWWFEFRAARREPIADLKTHLEENGISTSLARIHEVSPGPPSSRLTDSQLEAIRIAYDRGYFDEPRGVTLETLAAEVGISRQAFGGRLRRGLRSLVSTTVVESGVA